MIEEALNMGISSLQFCDLNMKLNTLIEIVRRTIQRLNKKMKGNNNFKSYKEKKITYFCFIFN